MKIITSVLFMVTFLAACEQQNMAMSAHEDMAMEDSMAMDGSMDTMSDS